MDEERFRTEIFGLLRVLVGALEEYPKTRYQRFDRLMNTYLSAFPKEDRPSPEQLRRLLETPLAQLFPYSQFWTDNEENNESDN